MIQLGDHCIDTPLMLAPMAGVSDLPFRQLCLAHGADLAVAEMVTSNTALWHKRKHRDRLRQDGDTGRPRIVQIAGAEPSMMAEAAMVNAAMGADVIDINMGCPAKKVLRRAAGSALLRDPSLVERILKAVISAVEQPVTLKIRTGWSPGHRNGVEIARIAEDAGVSMLTVHGRTRECRFRGEAEYDTIAAIRQAVSIPVIANGDIHDAEKARQVLDHTRADGLMIGRPAQGRPWIFSEIAHFLRHGTHKPAVSALDIARLLLEHIQRLHRFYGADKGMLFARKHVAWYSKHLPGGHGLKSSFNELQSSSAQTEHVSGYIDGISPSASTGREQAA